jgi:predicted nucleic acid-binding protein
MRVVVDTSILVRALIMPRDSVGLLLLPSARQVESDSFASSFTGRRQ